MSYDVVIVGGGAMGSSTAYHLIRADPSLSILVLERDGTYEQASTALSDGNVRVQFDLPENIRISQHTLRVLETFSEDMATDTYVPEVAARKQGNLFTVGEEGRAASLLGLNIQRELGCNVEWMDASAISETYPLYQSVGLAGGTLGHDDGSVDPSAVLRGYRAKATELGVEYVEQEVDSLVSADGVMTGVRLVGSEEITCDVVVNAAGAWSVALASGIGVDLPVEPVMRTVYVVSTPFSSLGLPSVFLPTGVYVISEGESTWLMGWSRPEDPVGFDFTPAGRGRFEDLLWPALVEALPAFDRLRVERAWAGLYAVNTLDGNAILGEWPEVRGLFLATGFSGHGFQQCPAVGRYLAESILAIPHELDLKRFGGQRVLDRQPLYEHAGRLI
jgi:glycine/D-amino acid oxidase-like deaminating enzyme